MDNKSKMRIGIIGSSSAGAFNEVPASLLDKEKVVLVDTDGKSSEDIKKELAERGFEEKVMTIKEPQPALLPTFIPYKESKHKGQSWAQNRKTKNRGKWI